jgi:hypothetical protein
MYKNALNIGTLAGMVSVAFFLALYYVGLSPLGPFKYIGFPVPILAIMWAAFKTRKEYLGGNMTFMQGFLLGSVTTLVWCTFKGFCIYIFLTVFEQHVIEQYIQFWVDYIEVAKSMGQVNSVNMIDLEDIKANATPIDLMFGDISNNLVFGSGMSFIIGLILKRVPKT